MWRNFTYKKLHVSSEGILVRFANKDDAKRISEYFFKNRDYLKPWEPKREPEFFTESGWKKRLLKLNELHLMSLGFYCLIIDESSDQMLGTISFSNLVRFPLHACSVGYSLDQHAQGKGVMRRALKLACDWMFAVQNIHKINASYMPKNKKSEAVLQANEFKQIGFAKDYLLIDGQWQDHNLTTLINPNWDENYQ